MEAVKKYTFLAIDDDPGDLELLGRQFEDLDVFDVEYISVADIESALAVLQKTDVDIVFVDYVLAGVNGIEVVGLIRESGFPQPVILLTGHGNEGVAIEAIRAGISDYVVKGFQQSGDLLRAITNALEKEALRQKIVDDKEKFKELATLDDLTGLHNRRYLFKEFAREMKRHDRTGQSFSVMMLDLDFFKAVNDEHGHLTGDKVLSKTAQRIKENLRASDVAFRYGGEEFCLMLVNTPMENAMVMAERLRAAIEGTTYTCADSEEKVAVTCSIGVAEFDDSAGDAEALIARADSALYAAKEGGRNRVVAYSKKK